MRTLIGISGKIGSGKDEIANRLVSHHGFSILRFSDALKKEVVEKFPRTLVAIHRALEFSHPWEVDPEIVDLKYMVSVLKPPIVRELLQEYGTEVRRGDNPDYWVHKWQEAFYESRSPRIVVPDMRFENEWDAILTKGGQVWRVERPRASLGTHKSETDLDNKAFDIRIQNEGTLDQLHKAVDVLMEKYFERRPSP